MAEELSLTGDDFDRLVRSSLAALSGDSETAGEPDALVAAMAQHLVAPVRATLVATSGTAGMNIRYTLVEDRVLVVAQPIAERAGETRPVGETSLVFARPDETWATIAGLLPELDALRAPVVTERSSAEPAPVPLSDPRWAREQANLQVRVEAWPEPTEAAVAWGRWWSVVDGLLYDVRRREGDMVGAERPAGSVAAEFEWAITGALDVVARATGRQEEPR